jgi:hypothetical protein
MGNKEMETKFSAISKYLSLQYDGTGTEHHLAVRRNDEFIVNKIN